MAAGIVVILGAFSQDISVPASLPSMGSAYGPPPDLTQREIVNTGLVQKQLMTMLGGSLATIVGAIFVAAAAVIDALRHR